MSPAPNPRWAEGALTQLPEPLLDNQPLFIETKSGYPLCMDSSGG